MWSSDPPVRGAPSAGERSRPALSRSNPPGEKAAVDYSRKWWVLATIMVGTFMSPLDGSVVNIALPTLTPPSTSR